MNKFLNEMVNVGILSDKERFVQELQKHNLVINKEMVEAIGYDGESELVPIDTEDMFVCCTCSRYCTSGYMGSCDTCNRCRCARCARGNPVHPCTTEVEEDSSDEPINIIYEVAEDTHIKYPFIGFDTTKHTEQHVMPCSFCKVAGSD